MVMGKLERNREGMYMGQGMNRGRTLAKREKVRKKVQLRNDALKLGGFRAAQDC